jgi:hypothetical protein
MKRIQREEGFTEKVKGIVVFAHQAIRVSTYEEIPMID